MTNEEMLDDLKQYIGIKTTALETGLETKLKDYIDERLTTVVSESTETILGAIGEKAELVDSQLENNDKRIAKLESAVA
jgi:hypothetical protein